MLKLLVTDVDDTLLLRGQREIDEKLLSLLGELKKRGLTVAAASGRSYFDLRHLFSPIADGMTFVCHDGALMVKDGKTLYHRPIPAEDLTRVSRSDLYRNCTLIFAMADRSAVLRGNDRLMRSLTERHADEFFPIASVCGLCGPVYKIAVYSENETPAELFPAPGGLRVCSHGGGWLEYVPRFADKGTALSDLQTRLFLAKYDAAVLGNGRNDLSMFRGASLSCAVPNAVGELKAAATVCADPEAFLTGLLTALDEKMRR